VGKTASVELRPAPGPLQIRNTLSEANPPVIGRENRKFQVNGFVS
jgi:hypothetical protein